MYIALIIASDALQNLTISNLPCCCTLRCCLIMIPNLTQKPRLGSLSIDLNKAPSETRSLSSGNVPSSTTSESDQSKANSPIQPSTSNAFCGALLTPRFDHSLAERPSEELETHATGANGSGYVDSQFSFRIVNHDIAHIIAEIVVYFAWESKQMTDLN